MVDLEQVNKNLVNTKRFFSVVLFSLKIIVHIIKKLTYLPYACNIIRQE